MDVGRATCRKWGPEVFLGGMIDLPLKWWTLFLFGKENIQHWTLPGGQARQDKVISKDEGQRLRAT